MPVEGSRSTAAVTAPHRAAAVRLWLGAVALLVLTMVLVGGATRLTDSGLSIVEWRPVTGAVPPLSMADWQAEFAKYRATPEYQRVNAGMSLDDFKTIYWWEWGHRFLGRLIGLAFAVPFVVFWWRGWFTRAYCWKLGGLLMLGGLQGAIGWWMVASGLVDRVDVSHYRLAVHLIVACLILAGTLWLAFDLSPAPRPAPLPGRHRGLALTILAALIVQIGAGALVAGLDAGLAHNTWPLLDGRLIPPPESLHVMRPAWLNHFENALTVQWQHRMLAYFVAALVVWHTIDIVRSAPVTAAARGARVLLVVTLAQVGLGVVTLVLQVPLWAGLAHQGFAMLLLAAAVRQVWLLPAAQAARLGGASAPLAP